MKIIVGLGNPGPEYDRTRHNVGFEVIDSLARRYAPGEVARSKFHSAVIDTMIGNEKVLLQKPTTYMNRSGLAVSEAARFYKVDVAEDVLVIVDDVALPCGQIRLRASGGAGGHNGLGDIEQKLATKDYPRLRIGVDKPGTIPQKDYVLGKFRPDQRDAVKESLESAVSACVTWIEHGSLETMNRFNQKADAASN